MFRNGLPMGSLALISLVAFVASLVLTAAVRSMARRWDIVDRPDGKRKLHGRPVPLLGGVAVYGATVLGLLAVHLGTARQHGVHLDFHRMDARRRLRLPCRQHGRLFQSPLAAEVGSANSLGVADRFVGYYIGRIVAFGYPIELGWLGMPLTVLWLVGCINALNLLDGMDGLASIVGLSTAAMLGVIAASQGQNHVAIMALTLAAGAGGFSGVQSAAGQHLFGRLGQHGDRADRRRAGNSRVFKDLGHLGDYGPRRDDDPADVRRCRGLVRRRLTGRRFDDPDRLHIHHRLLDRGWTPWQVLCLIGSLCLTIGAAATAATIFRRDALAWIAAMTLVVLMIRLRLFGHDEFALAKETAIRGWKLVLWHLRPARRADQGRSKYKTRPAAVKVRILGHVWPDPRPES